MKFRRGSMYVETTIGMTLAAIMMIGIAQLVALAVKQRHETRAMNVATQAASNQLERLMILPWDELNAETANQMELPDQVAALLDEPRLIVAVDSVEDAVPVRRITVRIDWINRSGLRVEPIQLTAWRHSAEATP